MTFRTSGNRELVLIRVYLPSLVLLVEAKWRLTAPPSSHLFVRDAPLEKWRGVVQKQKQKNSCKSQIEKKEKFLQCKRTRKTYPARTTDETVYTYYTVCDKPACSRKFSPLLPPTTLSVIPIITSKSFFRHLILFFSSDYQVVSLATGSIETQMFSISVAPNIIKSRMIIISL